MSTFTRRHFLGSLGALSAAGSVPGVLAASHSASGAMADEITGIEKEGAGFANPLRLPGSSGLFGVLPVSEFREVQVVRSEIEVLPGRRMDSPMTYWLKLAPRRDSRPEVQAFCDWLMEQAALTRAAVGDAPDPDTVDDID